MKTQSITHICIALTSLINRVNTKLHEEFREVLPPALISHLLREAESTALETGIPHLVLPLIAEEKLRFYAARSNQIAA